MKENENNRKKTFKIIVNIHPKIFKLCQDRRSLSENVENSKEFVASPSAHGLRLLFIRTMQIGFIRFQFYFMYCIHYFVYV